MPYQPGLYSTPTPNPFGSGYSAHLQSSFDPQEANFGRGNLQLQLQGAENVANIGAGAQTTSAMYGMQGQLGAANAAAGAQRYSALTGANAQRDVAKTQSSAQLGVANIGAGAQRDVANTQATSASNVAGIQGSTQRDVATTAANAAMFPAQLQQQRFNTVFPWLQGQFGQFQGQLNGMVGGGGLSGGYGENAGPGVTVGGVYNPQQIQQQVNASNAATDRSTATQNTQAAQQSGARGFGSNSPLLQAIYGQNQASGLGTRTSNEQQIRNTAAMQNQQARQSTQQAQAAIYGQRQQEALQARGQTLGAQSALFSALGGLI